MAVAFGYLAIVSAIYTTQCHGIYWHWHELCADVAKCDPDACHGIDTMVDTDTKRLDRSNHVCNRMLIPKICVRRVVVFFFEVFSGNNNNA